MSFYYDPNSVLKKEQDDKEQPDDQQKGPALSLPDQMLSKKHMLKVKDEVMKIKEIVGAMQIRV